MRNLKGFTLIELMIVVAIVAILAAIAYPSYQEQVRKNRRAQAKADLMEVSQALERKFTTDRTYVGYNFPASMGSSDFYTLGFSGSAGVATYTLQAAPKGAQASDRCGTLTFNNVGKKTHSAGSDDYCGWGGSP